jgi:enoyl-CoA hydratase
MTQENQEPPVLVERFGTENRIARLILNRPEKLNALSQDLLQAFEDNLRRLERDDSCRVIVIKGAGRAFSPGYDIGGAPPRPAQAAQGDVSATYQVQPAQARRLVWNTRTNMVRVSDMYLYFWNMAKVTIAQVHGYCLAGGVELAMMADLVIAAEDAQIGHPGIRGLGTSRTAAIWPLIIGMRRAKELLFTGDTISGKEAAEIGMINHAVPADQLDGEVERWAERIALQGADSLALQKRSVNTFFESLIYPGVHSATDTDAMYQFSSQAYLWQEKMREGGMREAVSWREQQYRDAPQIH